MNRLIKLIENLYSDECERGNKFSNQLPISWEFDVWIYFLDQATYIPKKYLNFLRSLTSNSKDRIFINFLFFRGHL